MKWKPDWNLRGRMLLTMGLLFGLYLVFLVVLTTYFRSLLLVGVLFGSVTLIQFLYSHKIALWSMGATTVAPSEYPELHRSIERLSQQADLPKPTVAVADTKTPNAFATGRSKGSAVVCVTAGLLDALDRDELDGVLAHELAHVKNRDMVVMTIASFLSTIAFLIVRWGWLFGGGGRGRGGGGAPVIVAILASLVVWIVSFFLIRALSRYREYAADRGGAIITGKPSALASALVTISGRMDQVPKEDLRSQNEMNAFFIIPIRAGFVGSLFRTHPSTEKRVERLQALEREMEGF